MAEYCMVQSFDFMTLAHMDLVNQRFIREQQKNDPLQCLQLLVATLYIHNYYHYITHSPIEEMVSKQGQGGHL